LASYTVVYDACVLYPAPLRDFLIELAAGGLFRAKWTDEIHEEWIGNLLANRPDLDRGKLETTRNLMNRAVIDCLASQRLRSPHMLYKAIGGHLGRRALTGLID
jgi:hypothetical protein